MQGEVSLRLSHVRKSMRKLLRVIPHILKGGGIAVISFYFFLISKIVDLFGTHCLRHWKIEHIVE